MSGLEVVVALVIAVGIAGVVVPVLPGSVLVVGAILLWAARTGTATGWVVFSVATALVMVGAVVKYVVPGRRLQDAGIPTSTMLLGGLLGGIGFFVIPVVGLVLGVVVGVYRAGGAPGPLPGHQARPPRRRTLPADRAHRFDARRRHLGCRRGADVSTR